MSTNCLAGARLGCVVAAQATCATHRRGFWRVLADRVTGKGASFAQETADCEAEQMEVCVSVRERWREREGGHG